MKRGQTISLAIILVILAVIGTVLFSLSTVRADGNLVGQVCGLLQGQGGTQSKQGVMEFQTEGDFVKARIKVTTTTIG